MRTKKTEKVSINKSAVKLYSLNSRITLRVGEEKGYKKERLDKNILSESDVDTIFARAISG